MDKVKKNEDKITISLQSRDKNSYRLLTLEQRKAKHSPALYIYSAFDLVIILETN